MRAPNHRPRAGATPLWILATLAALAVSGPTLPSRAASAASAASAESPAAAAEIRRPSLAGHTFLSTDLVPDAFVRTYVRNSLGYAQALDIQFAQVVVQGDTLFTLQGDLVYALLGLEYQQRVQDWLAARVAVGGRTRLGTQVSSLLAEGVTVNGGLELGWLARLRQTERTSLCASLSVSNQSSTVIDVKQFVEDVLNEVPAAKLIDNVPTVRTLGQLRFAWAASRPLGVTLLAGGSYGEAPQRKQPDSWEYEFGASVDFDAGPALGIPVGAALAYWQTSTPLISTTDTGVVQESVLRLAYNAQPDFLIAVDFLGVINREKSREDPIFAGGALVSLRYYF